MPNYTVENIDIEVREAQISIGKAGGNAGKEALSYRLKVPSLWMAALGISQEDRSMVQTFDGSVVLIRKVELTDTENRLVAYYELLREFSKDKNEIDVRRVQVSIGSAGGNAGKSSKTYSIKLPSRWMKSLGMTEEDRRVEVMFDGDVISIQKVKADESMKRLKNYYERIRKLQYENQNESDI